MLFCHQIRSCGYSIELSTWMTCFGAGIKMIIPNYYLIKTCEIIRPRGYKTFFMLNSAKHEIFSANKYENAKKELATVSNLRFINMKSFMLSWVEHERSFITSGQFEYLGCTMRKRVFGHNWTVGMPRPVCASTQSDQGIQCPLTEEFDALECINGEQMSEWNFGHMRNDVNPHILGMLKGTFLLDTSNL